MKKLILFILVFLISWFLFISGQIQGVFASDASLTPKEAKEVRDKNCDINGDCFDKESFKINVNTFSPWGGEILDKVWTSSVEDKANFFLGTAIQKMMIALWVLALLIMTAWGGFMILYTGKEEMLSKGKSLFMAGIISLFVALMSYVFISVIIFILYH